VNIGVLGSGKVGKALGAWAAKSGYEVAFSSRKREDAVAAAEEAGYRARSLSIEQLVSESKMILLTLPYDSICDALAPMRKHLDRKTLVDVTNPVTEDRRELKIGHDASGAEEIAKLFPMASVVKAFNAVFAEVYASQKPKIEGRPVSIFYAGDDPATKSDVRELILKLGFDPIDAGPLKNARYLEPLSLLNIQLGRVLGFPTRIGFSLLRG
jgi:8-hydroxy-5-deazaflavin:NADPH oxidoreductase